MIIELSKCIKSIYDKIYTYEDCKNFTDDEIFKMYGQDYLVWWHKYKDVLLKIWELNYGGIDVKSQNIFE